MKINKSLNFKKLILLVLFTGFNYISIVWCQENPTIPFKMVRNRTQLPVQVGNSRILKVILDSGMAYDGLLIYNSELIDSITIPNAVGIQIGGAGAGNPSTGIMLDSASFYVGDFKLDNQKIIILKSDTFKGFPSDGVMGYSILGHYATEIDYDKNIITLHDPDKLNIDETWEIIPIYFKDNNIPWIDASVKIENEEPVKLSMYIDYASGNAIELLERDVKKFKTPKVTKEKYLGRGLSGDIYGKESRISKLIIGSYELLDVVAAIAPAEVRSKQRNADGILGNNSLRRFNLIFDYAHRKLYIKPNSHFNEPFL